MWGSFRSVAALLALVATPAQAQSEYDAADVGLGLFDPAAFGLQVFEDTAHLYDLLTSEGRCPPEQMADPRQPCALIFYVRDGGAGDGPAMNFKPIFKVVSRDTIWAIHSGKLKKVRVENLYFDQTRIRGRPQTRYRSFALIGNAENAANCAHGKGCLSDLVVEDMFLQYGKMPDSVVDALWGRRMVDPGTVRVR